MTRAVVIAAPSSGSGKTVVTMALLRALTNSGCAAASFKVGPDYIDPAFHAAASRRPCRNLDLWAMRPDTLAAEVARTGAGAELVLGEGVMGLFDGTAGGGCATADLAAMLALPVILVVDAGRQGASVAALVEGFRDHRRDVHLAGVILNRVAGERHRAILERALDGVAPVLGHVRRDDLFDLPHRHLGLVQAHEHAGLDALLDRAASMLAGTVDLEGLAARARPLAARPARTDTVPLAPPGQRIAVACDAAFSFAYRAILEGWRRAGAEPVPFSPLADECPAADADAVYLPGGYPELHAGRLAAGTAFMKGLRDAARRGAFLFGECGGFMVLGEGMTDGSGKRHPMAGLLPVEVSLAEPRRHLGYRHISLLRDGPLGRAGTAWRGHEFHYASLVRQDAPCLFRARDAAGRDLGATGAVQGRVAASFLHIVDREEA